MRWEGERYGGDDRLHWTLHSTPISYQNACQPPQDICVDHHQMRQRPRHSRQSTLASLSVWVMTWVWLCSNSSVSTPVSAVISLIFLTDQNRQHRPSLSVQKTKLEYNCHNIDLSKSNCPFSLQSPIHGWHDPQADWDFQPSFWLQQTWFQPAQNTLQPPSHKKCICKGRWHLLS